MSSPAARSAGKGIWTHATVLLDPLPVRAFGAPAGDDRSLHDAVEAVVDEEIEFARARLGIEHLHLALALAAVPDEDVGRFLALETYKLAFADAWLDRRRRGGALPLAAPIGAEHGSE